MKKLILLLALIVPMATVGCKPVTTNQTPQTLAPGYVNAADQTMGETLAAAHAFYVQIQSDVASGKYTPNPTERTTLNNFATALNSAQIAYLAFHNGLGTQAQAQAAVTQVQNQQTALQAQIGQK